MQYLGVSLGNLIDINKLLQQNTLFSRFGGGRKPPEGLRRGVPHPSGVRSTRGAPGGLGGENLKTGVFRCVRSFSFSCLLFVREKKVMKLKKEN